MGTRHPAAGSGRVRAQAGTVGDAERAVCAWRAALHSAIRSLCHVTGTARRGQPPPALLRLRVGESWA